MAISRYTDIFGAYMQGIPTAGALAGDHDAS
jgi:hypothetical protein